MSASAAGVVLDGLRVVEISAFVAAPLGGMTLAQLGADVIRIDPPSGGLDYRRWPVTHDEVSLFWAGLNQCKRSVAIDITAPEGRELAAALVCAPGEDAGIALTNFPARSWLSYESLRKQRADLVQLTIQGDRNGGSALDYTVNASLGVPFITGPADCDEPVNHVLPAWDLITGQMAAVGLLAAERYRRRHGKGQHIKLALEDVGLAVMAHLGYIAEARSGTPRERHGNFLFGAFGRDFVCADGERVMIVGLTAKQWRSLVDATHIAAGIATLERQLGLDLQQEGNRFRARREIAALVGAWVAARPLGEVASAFDGAGVCWSRYRRIAQLAVSDAVDPAHNAMFSVSEHPGIGPMLSAGIPLDFTDIGRKPATPAPRLGQHTEEVLCDLLALTTAEYGRLRDRGIVADDGK